MRAILALTWLIFLEALHAQHLHLHQRQDVDHSAEPFGSCTVEGGSADTAMIQVNMKPHQTHMQSADMFTSHQQPNGCNASADVEAVRVYINGSSDLYRFSPSVAHFVLGHILPVATLLHSRGLLHETELPVARMTLHFLCPRGSAVYDSACDARKPQRRFPAPMACCQNMLSPGDDSNNRLDMYKAFGLNAAELVESGAELISAKTKLGDEVTSLASVSRREGRRCGGDIALQMPRLKRATVDPEICSAATFLNGVVKDRVPRVQRTLHVLYVSRRVADGHASFTQRMVLNDEEVVRNIREFALEASFNFTQVYLEDVPKEEQIPLIANTDFFISMHGAALAFAAFLPARSVVIEVLPIGFDYCMFHRCLAHNTIWIQLVHDQHESQRSNGWDERGQTAWHSSRNVDITHVLNLLREATSTRNSSLMSCPGARQAGAPTVQQWMLDGDELASMGVFCPSHPRVKHKTKHMYQGPECHNVRGLTDGPIFVRG